MSQRFGALCRSDLERFLVPLPGIVVIAHPSEQVAPDSLDLRVVEANPGTFLAGYCLAYECQSFAVLTDRAMNVGD